jgi:hypothetical protein
MATVYPELDERLIAFIKSQPMFFVATAPCLDEAGDGGHVNVSPKGYSDTFAVLDPQSVAYLDLTGSGAETIAHLRQNGKITIMFCSFGRQPKILRLYGTGRSVLPGDADWPDFAAHFNADPCTGTGTDIDAATGTATETDTAIPTASATGSATGIGTGIGSGTGRGNQRAIIVVAVDRISDSCGYAVPVMELTEERDLLTRWSERRSADDLVEYRVKHNRTSIDGLPALG